ncbi:GNAT family N-acetyltransferase [Xylanibacillus composti]|uniref:Spermidine acetyltransferase n=1 Tax=Xylanibacillus composti TaxID=1572762 RepID=A0A8J4H903_9BACL|nr:GNAT family N-acetyltransferase [Xylanibacillus composti]MDT9727145.1 GNAT family N-acetyltransferase [Xylanibacillus composti]GIQ71409.1 spermidine acetyltransferase [Xylanibacillus composti]
MISLRSVDQSNWEECIKLKPKIEQQRFIASNLYSIAECQFLTGFVMKAIYFDEELVGFSMYGVDPDDLNYWIYRFMIDERFQSRGYGKQAMKLIIRDVEAMSDRKDVLLLGYKPDNEQAKNLYEKVGFQEIGIAPWGEMLAKYSFC